MKYESELFDQKIWSLFLRQFWAVDHCWVSLLQILSRDSQVKLTRNEESRKKKQLSFAQYFTVFRYQNTALRTVVCLRGGERDTCLCLPLLSGSPRGVLRINSAVFDKKRITHSYFCRLWPMNRGGRPWFTGYEDRRAGDIEGKTSTGKSAPATTLR